MAEWRDIAGYHGVCHLSDHGQVRSAQNRKFIQPVKVKNGRLYDTLWSGGFQRKMHGLLLPSPATARQPARFHRNPDAALRTSDIRV